VKSLFWKITATFILVVLVSMVAGATTFQAVFRSLRPWPAPDAPSSQPRARGGSSSVLWRAIGPLRPPRGHRSRYGRSQRALLELLSTVTSRELGAELAKGATPEDVGGRLATLVAEHPDVIAAYVTRDGVAHGPGAEALAERRLGPGAAAGETLTETLDRLEEAGVLVQTELPVDRGWLVLGYERPRYDPRDRDELSRHMSQAGAAGMSAVLLVALLVGMVAFRAIARPLRVLADALGDVAEGDLARRVPEGGADEIGRLGRSFNRMAERLQELVRRLEDVDVRRREFLAHVSHELRTPLTSVRANLESMIEREDSAVALSLEEVEHMGCLVEDLLELARMESPGYALEREEVVLQRLVANTIARLKTSVQNRHVEISTHLDPEPLRRLVDARRITQVVTNLLVNAIRSVDEGGKIEVTVAERDGRALIEVADDGPGIPESQREHLFEPFRSGTRGGTGLGLAIVRKLVESHGGRVELVPREPHGTIARVEI
jgi:signal transduction histidine kinase